MDRSPAKVAESAEVLVALDETADVGAEATGAHVEALRARVVAVPGVAERVERVGVGRLLAPIRC